MTKNAKHTKFKPKVARHKYHFLFDHQSLAAAKQQQQKLRLPKKIVFLGYDFVLK